MIYLIIIFLGGISFVALVIWLIKETWNDRGIKGELEEANRLKRMELQFGDIVINGQEIIREEMQKISKETNEKLEKVDNELNEKIEKINQKHLSKIKNVEMREKLKKIYEDQRIKFDEINKKRNEELKRINNKC